jgi:hypothetical protein
MGTIRSFHRRRRIDTTATTTTTSNATVQSLNDPITQPERPHLTAIGYLVVAGLFIVVAICLWLMAWFTWRRHRRQHIQHNRPNTHRDSEENPTSGRRQCHDTASSKQRIQRRYETIEHWIVTKRVLPHTACCTAIQSILWKNQSIPTENNREQKCSQQSIVVSSLDDNDNKTNTTVSECPICMSDILLGQIVSWSSNPQCSHGTLHSDRFLSFPCHAVDRHCTNTLTSTCYNWLPTTKHGCCYLCDDQSIITPA